MRRLRHAVTGLTLLTFFGVSGAVAQTPGSEGGGASQDGATASGGSSAQAEAELKKLGEERKSLVDEDIESLSGDQMLKR
ncbi:MAG: hypothetical protein ABEL76_15000, partial [Bradymonadaceae bacterium]